MKIHLGLGVASLVAISCGGGARAKGATTASSVSAGASAVSLDLAGDAVQGAPGGKLDLSGPAFSQFDPEQKALMIYVFDPASTPAPTCDTVGLAGMTRMKSGAMATIATKEFSGASGTFKPAMAMYLKGDASKLQPDMAEGMLEASTITVTTYDTKSIEATIASDASAKSKVTATIHGTVCPNASITDQANEAVSAQSAAGK